MSGGGAVGRKIQVAEKREKTSEKMCQMDVKRKGRDLHYDKITKRAGTDWKIRVRD